MNQAILSGSSIPILSSARRSVSVSITGYKFLSGSWSRSSFPEENENRSWSCSQSKATDESTSGYIDTTNMSAKSRSFSVSRSKVQRLVGSWGRSGSRTNAT